MTAKELRQYPILVKSIHDLEHRIALEEQQELDGVQGRTKGSMPGHPYIECSFKIQVDDPGQAERRRNRISQWRFEIGMYNEKIRLIEKFVSDIADPQLRMVFRMRFIDGIGQQGIAAMTGFERSSISKKISKYLETFT